MRKIGFWVGLVLVTSFFLILPGSVQSEVSAHAVPGLWTKYAGNPVMSGGEAGSWDEVGTFDPSVILDGLTYKMWYTGRGSTGPHRLGYAVSNDGIDWIKFDGNPVLSEGPAGSWDEEGARFASVLLDGDVYKMWYTGRGLGVNQIGYATSSNGTSWAKHGNNPVLDVGAPGSWEDKHVLYPAVIKDGGTYKMWYTGWSASGDRTQIGYATSPDGINWVKYPDNPVLTLGSPGNWDDQGVYAASVLLDNGTYHLWYSGGNSTEWQIGHATSPDGISWTKDPANPVITEGPEGSFDSDSADYPSLSLEDNLYKMWYSGWNSEGQIQIGYAYAPATYTYYVYLPIVTKGY